MTRQLPDRCLRVLSRQAGVIAIRQVQAAGLSSWQIDNLLHSGRWQRLHYGVYAAFTGQPPQPALLWAGALRAGPNAVLSHQTAAELDGLLGRAGTLIHVTVPHAQHSKLVPGIRIHRSSRSIGIKQYRGLPPQTMTEETVLDLA